MSNSLPRRLFTHRRSGVATPQVDLGRRKAEGRRDSFAGQLTNSLKSSLREYCDLEWNEDFTRYGIDYMEVPLRHLYIGDKQHNFREIIDIRVEVVQEDGVWITRIRVSTLMWTQYGFSSFCPSYRIIPVEKPEEVAAIARAIKTHLRGKRDPKVLTTESVADILKLLTKHDFYYGIVHDRPESEFELPEAQINN